jgi:hypothetical protein
MSDMLRGTEQAMILGGLGAFAGAVLAAEPPPLDHRLPPEPNPVMTASATPSIRRPENPQSGLPQSSRRRYPLVAGPGVRDRQLGGAPVVMSTHSASAPGHTGLPVDALIELR